MFNESCLKWHKIEGGKEAFYHGGYICFFDGAAEKGNLPWYASDVSAKTEVPEDDEWKHMIVGFDCFMDAVEEIDSWDAYGCFCYSVEEGDDWREIIGAKDCTLVPDNILKARDGSITFDLNSWDFRDSDDWFVAWTKKEGGKLYRMEFTYKCDEE